MAKRVKCLRCGDVLESKHRRDFVQCSCEGVFLDGGDDCPRMGVAEGVRTETLADSEDLTKRLTEEFTEAAKGITPHVWPQEVEETPEDAYEDEDEREPLVATIHFRGRSSLPHEYLVGVIKHALSDVLGDIRDVDIDYDD